MKKSKAKPFLGFVLFSLLLLTSCANIETTDIGNKVKRIELTDPPILAYPRRAAFAHHETQMAMNVEAYKVCENGFRIIKEEYIENNSQGKDALVWDIKCAVEEEK